METRQDTLDQLMGYVVDAVLDEIERRDWRLVGAEGCPDPLPFQPREAILAAVQRAIDWQDVPTDRDISDAADALDDAISSLREAKRKLDEL